MNEDILVPWWLLALLSAGSAAFVVERMIAPGLRWYLRRRLNRALDEVNRRLSIRIAPFKLTRREALIDRLVFDARVVEAADEEADARNAPRAAIMARVKAYAREIVPAFNAYFYFRVGYWLARRVAQLMYDVRFGVADEMALTAIDRKATVVFVMNHRSNMDYVLVGFLAAERAALSYAVGEWARIWPLHQLIRAMGAYFVRRNSKDPLYRRVMERYIQMATEEGVCQAVFPEGGLSRDGKLRAPKLGLVDYMTKTFDPAGERDIVFVPVGINYDRVIEDRSLLRSLEPDARARSLAFVVWTTLRFIGRNVGQMIRGDWFRFGHAAVAFGRPISLAGWLEGRKLDLRRIAKEERFVAVENLLKDLMTEIGRVVPALPVPLIAAGLIEAGDKGATALELKTAAAKRLADLAAAGVPPIIPPAEQDAALDSGLRHLVLRKVAVESEGIYRVAPGEERLFAYYARSLG
ncbi:MAG: glycerol-3-phosphate acyltransferase [Alphaproteobacteria bacterium]|nr:glycerol-3-phosphate acyltransferase [Alphaproteobacteria bacterium]